MCLSLNNKSNLHTDYYIYDTLPALRLILGGVFPGDDWAEMFSFIIAS